VGGGTLLVLLAQSLPDDSVLRSWIVVLAPSVSVALSALWLWIRREIDRQIERRRFEAAIREARAALMAGVENPNTSDAHKEELRKHLEELEMLLVQANMDRIRILRPRT